MTSIPALHIQLEGLTASFRHPLTISGTQISTPMPAYSNILGMISACAGRVVKPSETRVGFEFHCQSHDLELERTVRWVVKKGRLKPQPFMLQTLLLRVLLKTRRLPPASVAPRILPGLPLLRRSNFILQ